MALNNIKQTNITDQYFSLSITYAYLTSSSLYNDNGDDRTNTYTPPLYILPFLSWLFCIQLRGNSHSGLNQNP